MLSIEIITSKFGRVVPDSPTLVVPLGFKISGAISGSPTYEKSLDGTTWTPMSGNTAYNLNTDGFVTEYSLPPAVYDFHIREVGNTSNTGSVTGYNLELDIVSQGLHSLGSTPKILNTLLDIGSNRQITVQTVLPNQAVKIYGSSLVSGQEVFSYPYIPIIEGYSNENSILVATIPSVRENQKFVASAQGEFELESFCVNRIVGGLGVIGASQQLSVAVSIGNLTVSGRNVVVSVTGGSGNYSISKGIGENWSYIVGQNIELPFGRRYVIVKDNTTGLIFSKAVHIIPAGQQVITDINLRGDFSTTDNPNNRWTYGYLNDGTFEAFNSFGVRGSKQGWGKDSYALPMVGYGDNNTTLDINSLVLAPHSTEQGSTVGYGDTKAVARYTFGNSGIFNTSSFKVKKPTRGNLLTATYYIKYEVKLNSTLLQQGILTFQGEEIDIVINNLTVQTGDVLSIIADSASEADTNSPVFDELHVNLAAQLVSTTYISPTAPNTPILVSGTGNSTSEIVQGTTIVIKTEPTYNWLVLSRNNIPISILKTSLVSTDYLYTFIGGIAGTYSLRTVANGVFNSGDAVSFNVRLTGATVPSTPIITSPATTTKGQTIKISVSDIGSLQVFKDDNLVSSIAVTTVNSTLNYTALDIGAYTFKLLKNGVLSNVSTTVNVGSGNTECGIFVDNFILGSYTQGLNSELSVFSLNGQRIIRQKFEDGYVLWNSNFINSPLVVSNYKGYESCFGYPKPNLYSPLTVADLGNIQGFKWSVTTDGYNVPYIVPDNSVYKTYRVCAKTACENETILFAISATISNPASIPAGEFKDPDGTVKVNSDNVEDVNGSNYFYKNFTVPSGMYTVFYKVKNSPATPIMAVSQQFN